MHWSALSTVEGWALRLQNPTAAITSTDGHGLNILLKFTLTVGPANSLGSGDIYLNDNEASMVWDWMWRHQTDKLGDGRVLRVRKINTPRTRVSTSFYRPPLYFAALRRKL